MQRIKSVLCVLLTAALMLSLTACVQQPDTTTLPSSADDSASTTAPIGTSEPVKLDINLTDKWTKPNIETAEHFAFSDKGCYYYNGVLQFMDTENGISVVLCTRPGCRHADEENAADCEAYISGLSMFFSWDGHIYYSKTVQDDPYGIHLFRRSADGTAEEEVATLAEEYCTPKTSVGISRYVVADGILYCLANLAEMVEVAPNDFSIMERDTMILRLDLHTGKQEELVRYENTYIGLFGARDNALLFYTQERLPSEENLAPDYYERMQELPARLHVWTESNNRVVTLFEKANKECSWVYGLMGNVLLYTDDTNQYAYDLATNSHSAAQLPFPFVIVNDNYILAQCQNAEDMAQGKYSRFWDVRTEKHIPSDFDDADIFVVSISDNGCIIDIRYVRELEPSGGGYIVHTSREIQAYVSFAAMEDGLQESDILVISDTEYES